MVAIKDMEMPSSCINCDIRNGSYCYAKNKPPYNIIGNLLTRDENCPLVEVEEHKTGEWIFAYGTKGKDNVEKCSCCGSHWKEAIIYRTDTQEYLRTRLPYCPNCGADMRGSENEVN